MDELRKQYKCITAPGGTGILMWALNHSIKIDSKNADDYKKEMAELAWLHQKASHLPRPDKKPVILKLSETSKRALRFLEDYFCSEEAAEDESIDFNADWPCLQGLLERDEFHVS